MSKSSPKLKIEETTAPAAHEAPAPSPSAELLKEAMKSEMITDGRGRRILMRKPGVLAQYRIVEAVGPELASNQTYMAMVNPLLWVGEIDGDPVSVPRSKREVEALIQRLDEDGLEAAMAWYMVHVIAATEEAIDAETQR